MNTFKWISRLIAILLLAQLGGLAVAQERITYLHTDALGSPIAASDEDGNFIWRESYQPYGKRLRLQKGSDRPWYTGKYEEDIGLVYYGKRWYNPEIGRFYSVDPVRFDENNIHSFNRYAYANNNPYKFVDPDGASAVTAVGGLLYESGQFLTGKGFDGRRVWGALKDGYDGQGEGFGQAAFDDATTFIPMGIAAGTLAKLGRLAKHSKVPKSVARAVDANKLNHIFGKAEHGLGDVVKAAGSREAAFGAMEKAAQGAFDAGKLASKAPSVFEGAVNVGGVGVTVRGAVVDGVFKIGSAWR